MASSASFQPPRGMRDFYPEDMRRRNHVFTAWRSAALTSGFEEYDACVVENLDLLVRKAGEEITDQIYHFKDKSGRDLALRPEVTPTLARMIAARQGALSFPLKWFTIAQCFRYERTTRGRKREHYQWNIDILGVPDVSAEVEVLATAAQALTLMGLDERHVRIHYSSRELISELLTKLGIPPSHHAAAFLALDKRGKIPDDAIRTLLHEEGVPSDAIPAVFQLLEISSINEAQELLGDHSPALLQLNNFTAMAEAYGLASMLYFDIGVIRGLAYYTGIVFEAFDCQRELRALFGGGRYAKLLSSIGGADITGVGLGFGDVVIAELLKVTGSEHSDISQLPHIRIGFMTGEQQQTAIGIAAALRRRQERVELSLTPEKPKAFFSRAGGSGSQYALFIGPDDVQSGTARIKHLQSRTQQEVPLKKLLEMGLVSTLQIKS